MTTFPPHVNRKGNLPPRQLPDFEKTHPLPGNELLKVHLYDDYSRWQDAEPGNRETVAELADADVVTSAVAHSERLVHRPVIDIDLPCKLVPSTTPGHFHLYIDKVIPSDAYFDLLDTLAEVGIVEKGFARAARVRGYSAARLPWVKKEPAPPTKSVTIRSTPPPSLADFDDDDPDV
jgi:hypothetical protein